jgi:hypothetical protein
VPTFAALQTLVLANIIDTPTAVQSKVPAFLNQALRDLQDRHNFRVMEALSGPHITAVDTRVLVACPTNFKEHRGDPYELTPSGGHRPLGIAPDRMAVIQEFGSDEAEADADTIIGCPQAILRGEPTNEAGASNFEVWPLTDSLSLWADSDPGEYRVYIPYWKYMAELAADGDSNWFTTNAADWLEWQATSHGFFADWNDESAQVWTTRAGTVMQRIVSADKRFRWSGVKTLYPQPSVLGSRLGRRSRYLPFIR